MNDRTTYSSSLLSFLLGSLAGAGLALLFAPQSGRDTRHAVGRRVRSGVDAAKSLGDRVTTRGRELRARAERSLSDALESGEAAGERAVERAEHHRDRML